MRGLLRLIHCAKTRGVGTLSELEGAIAETSIDPLTNDEIDALCDIQPFVFDTFHQVESPIGLKVEFDAPFRVFSIEVMNNHLCYTENQKALNGITIDELYLKCIVAIEEAPGVFSYLISHEFLKDGQPKMKVTRCSSGYWTGVLSSYLSKMNSQRVVGVQKSKEVLKFKINGEKRTGLISKVIHICPEKKRIEYEKSASGKIEWDHKWLCRGHWRKQLTSAYGKDRAGNYCVPGYTWVSEHERGNPDAPLINKTRVVHNIKQGELNDMVRSY